MDSIGVSQKDSPMQVNEAYIEHFKKCPGKAGRTVFPSNKELVLEIKLRATPSTQLDPWESDGGLLKPYCYRAPGARAVGSKDDCIIAYNTVPVDPRTGYITRTSGFQITYRSCMIRMDTTDGSPNKMKKVDADSAIFGMIEKCDKLPGVVNLNGASGPNGRLFVRTIGVDPNEK
ncbi:hypothetical protein, variant [Puccinia triticina 1-1 BBBD Race 1]|uniref:Uncharacterized protein n=1 Tax=Puccinia triticina (isolate 1-1 / race 1 (BBBD)) TaxID=630390 RepID=A0A180GJF3_PUCT1|nr:hypothetical protein, variant [Puccinia triticina 1-1 BBBD Race 1]